MSALKPSRDARRWLTGLAVVTVCSWGRYFATGSLKVDESYPSEAVGTALFLAAVLGWGLLLVGWRGLLARPEGASPALAFGALGLASLMLPMFSNDVFSLFAYGSLAAKGHDVYVSTAWLTRSEWYGWIGEHWNEKVCVYGPLTLLATMPVSAARANPWLALAILRAIWLIPLAWAMRASFRRLGSRAPFHAMVWLNPLWIVEGPGQLHGEVLGVVAIVAGILLARAQRPTAGWIAWSAAALCKYTFAIGGFWFWLFGAAATRERWLRIPKMALVAGVLSVVCFGPFWRGASTITAPFAALASMNPGGSITEVVGDVVDLARGGGVPRADVPVREGLEQDRLSKASVWKLVSLILRIVTLGVGARVIVAVTRRPYDAGAVALGTGVLTVAVVTLASHRFQSWYLIAALPFFGLRCTDVWRRWWVAAVALSVAPEFACLLPRTAFVLPPWVGLTTAGSVVVFLTSFRARYVDLDWLPTDDANGGAAALSTPGPTAFDEQPHRGQEDHRREQATDLAHHGDDAQAADPSVD